MSDSAPPSPGAPATAGSDNPAQRYWVMPAKVAAWLAGLIGFFLLPPPQLQYYGDSSGAWLHVVQFVLAVLVGLFFLGPPARPEAAKRWRNIAIAGLLLGIALFIAYQALRPQWSCTYRGVQVMAGTTLLERAAQYQSRHPSATCDRLIATALGRTERVWPMGDLVQGFILLGILHTFTMLAFAIAALAMIEKVRSRAPPGG